MRCLFVSPMKAPGDPTPSGDRTVARLFVEALGRLGFAVEPATTLAMRLRDGSQGELDHLKRAACAEIDRIVDVELRSAAPASLIFTYHVYYKAPDLVGPALARRLGAPYVIAEASRAPRRAEGAFAEGLALAESAIDAARVIFASTTNDRPMLDRFLQPHQEIVDLKPFIDLSAWPGAAISERAAHVPPRLLAVGMMRRGDKTRSYRQLADALSQLRDRPWRLDVVGDGANREEILSFFASLGDRVEFHGRVDDGAALTRFYLQADLFVWPGVNEAYGMAYLEAQAHGVPCVAGAHGGVPDVVRHAETGLLVERDRSDAFAQAVAALLDDEARRRSMQVAAARFVAEERTIEAAVGTMRGALRRAGVLPRQTEDA